MKIEIPYRFRIAMGVAQSLHHDRWLPNMSLKSTRKFMRYYGAEILSLQEDRDSSDLTLFTVRFQGCEKVEIWMKDHKNGGTHLNGSKMEDWRIHRAELSYPMPQGVRIGNPLAPERVIRKYFQADLLRIKHLPHGWHNHEVYGEIQHIGE